MALGTSLGLFQGLPSPSSSSLETAKALNIEAYKSPDRASGHWLKEGMVEDGAHFHKSHQGGDLWNGKERHRMLGPALYTGESVHVTLCSGLRSHSPSPHYSASQVMFLTSEPLLWLLPPRDTQASTHSFSKAECSRGGSEEEGCRPQGTSEVGSRSKAEGALWQKLSPVGHACYHSAQEAEGRRIEGLRRSWVTE